MDMISKLPQGIIETILCLLPIKEAVRTSILSSEWRYQWTKIPKLVFTEEAFQVSTEEAYQVWNEEAFQVSAEEVELSFFEQMYGNPSKRDELFAKRCKLFYAINQVLLMHQGPIREFTIIMEYDRSFSEFDHSMQVKKTCVEIDRIILHLSKKNTVNKLHLDFNACYEGYKLPMALFSLHQLTNMFLSDCTILHERSFNEFGCLTNLFLECLWTCEKTLLRLLSSCPLLKILTLECDNSTISDSGHTTIDKLFECLPVIEHLSISFFIITCFVPERLPKELPTALVHLKYLSLNHVCFTHIYGLRFLALLIRSCPNLEKLRLLLYSKYWLDEVDMGSFTLEDFSDIMLEHLNELEVVEFTDAENELDFVKLVLAKSPALKKVSIFSCCESEEDEESRISNDLSCSPSASPVVKITVKRMVSK